MSVIVRCNYAHSATTILLVMFPAEVKRGERGDNEVGQKKNPEHMTAIFDMCMLVIGDDEHGVMPAVIGGVGILAHIAKYVGKSLALNAQPYLNIVCALSETTSAGVSSL
ncbi:hypothetical protein PISMIDRAFT_19803 [Pisolithus microcarpus 441]|uniref:Uncharacterized protein n=1 Tax=Pisolithus microcarpus 441 TaxID=765257 RepID=A0A0C9YT96_9AGAM|nr:hypothetical protein PISMIDRAFT_19803 [Pisolithus microcarpus 441]